MTASTEQERALANLRHLYKQMVNGAVKDSAQARRIAEMLLSPSIAKLEQAARRAPVVPQGWKLVPEKATFGMLDAMHEICGVNGKPWPGLVDAASRKYAAMLAAAPQPACNPSMQPTQELRDKAEHEALREVYENARGVLRYDGIDAARLQAYMQGLSNAVEEVKLIDSGLWEPEVAQEGGK